MRCVKVNMFLMPQMRELVVYFNAIRMISFFRAAYTRRTELCFVYIFLYLFSFSHVQVTFVGLETKFTLLLSCPYSSPSALCYIPLCVPVWYIICICYFFVLHFMAHKALCNVKKYKEIFQNVFFHTMLYMMVLCHAMCFIYVLVVH